MTFPFYTFLRNVGLVLLYVIPDFVYFIQAHGEAIRQMGVKGETRGQRYVQKMRAELELLERMGVRTSGNAFSSVLFAKGRPGPAEQAGGTLLSGADGKALRAALNKLGYAPEDWAAIDTSVTPELLRRAVTALDPSTLVACDDEAAMVIRNAYAENLCELANLDDALLSPGRVVQVAGMRVLNLGGFEAALASSRQKQVVWAYLKRIPPLGEPY
jgi:hypothetical protein